MSGHVVVPVEPETMLDIAANLRTWADTVQRWGLMWNVDGQEEAEDIREWAEALAHAVPVRVSFSGNAEQPREWVEVQS